MLPQALQSGLSTWQKVVFAALQAPFPRLSPMTMPGINGLSEQGSEAVASPADLPVHVIVARGPADACQARCALL